MSARVAIYYAPARSDLLWEAGSRWLGRDAQTGRRQPGAFEELTASPRRYGFHATLKPPMRPAHPWRMLLDDVAALAARLAPFDLPQLAVADLGGFLALCEAAPCPALHALADACVLELDPHREPADAAELAKRRQAGLTQEQDALLVDWGYPHVLSQWRFHMTLSRRLDAAERARALPVAQAHFAPALASPRRVEDICVFTQVAPGSPFMLAERLALGG